MVYKILTKKGKKSIDAPNVRNKFYCTIKLFFSKFAIEILDFFVMLPVKLLFLIFTYFIFGILSLLFSSALSIVVALKDESNKYYVSSRNRKSDKDCYLNFRQINNSIEH